MRHMWSVYLHRNMEVYPIGGMGMASWERERQRERERERERRGEERGGEGREGEGKKEKQDKLLKFQRTSHYDVN